MALLCLALLPGCFLTRNQAASAEYARQVMVASTRVAVLEAQLAEAGARVESLEEAMRAQGIDVYYVKTLDDPANRALRFYDENGFKRIGHKEEGGRRFVEFHKALAPR